jgi:hypothetical protein
MGRPTELTEDLITRIANHLRLGAYIETAVAVCGINKENFYEWSRKGARKEDPLCEALVYAVEKAQAEAEQRDLLRIDKAAEDGSWQASAWKLERKFPRKWGRRDTLTMEGGEQPIQFALTKSQLKEMAKEILYSEQEAEKRSDDPNDAGQSDAFLPGDVAELPMGSSPVEDI